MKRGTPDHWKMKELARLCKVPAQYSLPWANGVMERLWHYTAKYCLQGNIGKVPNAEIAEVCGWPVRRADELVIALLQSGWLDSSKNHRLLVHDWAEHAEDSVKKTLKNRGLQFFFPETSGNVPTFSACLSHSQAIAKPEPLATPEMGHVAERMYAAHPKKRNWPLVLPALLVAVSSGASISDIEICHAKWCATESWQEKDGRFAPKLDEWLGDKGYTQHPNGSKPEKHVPTAKELISQGII